MRGRSLDWLEYWSVTPKVAGSNPVVLVLKKISTVSIFFTILTGPFLFYPFLSVPFLSVPFQKFPFSPFQKNLGFGSKTNVFEKNQLTFYCKNSYLVQNFSIYCKNYIQSKNKGFWNAQNAVLSKNFGFWTNCKFWKERTNS